MTRCDELNRWLDEGMPAEGAASARAHAATCPSCAEALGAIEAIDRALATAPRTLPDGAAFSARVMERVRTVAPLAVPVPALKRDPWWITIFSEPGFAVAAAAAVVLIVTPTAVRLGTTNSVALPLSVAMQTLGSVIGSTLAGWFDSTAFAARLTPLSRICILIGFAPLFVWAGLWMFGAVERLVRNSPARRG